MSRIISMLKLDPEAQLFDARNYIIKTFLAIMTAYFLAKNNEFIQLDMISVLFGLMLTLEPVTLTGMKSGWQQVYATLIGAFATMVIIAVFNNNIITVALSLSFTLYVGLKINWKAVSPFAIFTSIYMTQYVQLNSAGEPSLLLTFQLRMLALGLGVIVAIAFNTLFSLFSYRKLGKKRVAFIVKKTYEHLNAIIRNANNKEKMAIQRRSLPQTFNDIDWLSGLLEDLKFDQKILSVFGTNKSMDLNKEKEILNNLRIMNHLVYDLSLAMPCETLTTEHKNKLEEVLHEINKIYDYYKENKKVSIKEITQIEGVERVPADINELVRHIAYTKELLIK